MRFKRFSETARLRCKEREIASKWPGYRRPVSLAYRLHLQNHPQAEWRFKRCALTKTEE